MNGPALSNANTLSNANASSALWNTMHCQMQMHRQHVLNPGHVACGH